MNTDRKVQCTTCRNIHEESERRSRPNSDGYGCTLVCPACSGTVYWKNPVGRSRRQKARNQDEWIASYQQP